MNSHWIDILQFGLFGFICGSTYKFSMNKLCSYNYPEAKLTGFKHVSISLEPDILQLLTDIHKQFDHEQFQKVVTHVDTLITLKDLLDKDNVLPTPSDKLTSYGCLKIVKDILETQTNKNIDILLQRLEFINVYIFDKCVTYYE